MCSHSERHCICDEPSGRVISYCSFYFFFVFVILKLLYIINSAKKTFFTCLSCYINLYVQNNLKSLLMFGIIELLEDLQGLVAAVRKHNANNIKGPVYNIQFIWGISGKTNFEQNWQCHDPPASPFPPNSALLNNNSEQTPLDDSSQNGSLNCKYF